MNEPGEQSEITYESAESDRVRQRLFLWIGGAGLAAALFVALATLFARVLQPVAVPQAAGVEPALEVDDTLLPGEKPRVINEPVDALFRMQTDVETAAAGAPAPAATPVPDALAKAARPPEANPLAPDLADTRAAVVPTGAAPPQAPPAPAAAAAPADGRPRIALVVTELGDDPATVRTAIRDLPPAVSLAFAPFGRDLRALAREARSDGHEIWLGLPMQPRSYPRIDPGENALLVRQSPEETERRLTWLLSRLDSYAGVYSMMGSALTEDRPALDRVMARVARQGVRFLDARSSAATLGPQVAKAHGVAVAVNDRFIDDDPAPAAVEAAFSDLEKRARRNGSAVGLISARTTSLAAARAWTAAAAARGIALVPASTLTR